MKVETVGGITTVTLSETNLDALNKQREAKGIDTPVLHKRHRDGTMEVVRVERDAAHYNLEQHTAEERLAIQAPEVD